MQQRWLIGAIEELKRKGDRKEKQETALMILSMIFVAGGWKRADQDSDGAGASESWPRIIPIPFDEGDPWLGSTQPRRRLPNDNVVG